MCIIVPILMVFKSIFLLIKYIILGVFSPLLLVKDSLTRSSIEREQKKEQKEIYQK